MTSTIKVNNVQNQCGQNIINENSNTITLGASGDTIALASGASQSGFGRTGTVDWQTTPKTGDFTAVNGEGYFVNTTSSAVTMTMPSGSAGAIVSIQDYNKTFDSNALTITPASGEKINGGTANGDLIVNTEGQGLTFVYVDATVGWKTVHENEFTQGGSSFIIATGGTITTSGNCKIHTFTGPGTFTVSTVADCAANNVVSHLVVAGGGGGTCDVGGGGGAGGYREVKAPTTPYTASPLDGYPSAPNRVTVTATAFPITVGAGGAAGAYPPTPQTPGCSGSNSIFSTVTSAGGGGGGGATGAPGPAINGGSGGGGYRGGQAGGTGNSPPVSPAQGRNGGDGGPSSGGAGGGGGAGCNGQGGSADNSGSAAGGCGVSSSITGSPVARAGGGGGGTRSAPSNSSPGGAGGSGGGGAGAGGVPNPSGLNATPGTVNTGGGGGGTTNAPGSGGTGGSGIVIIRYRYQ